MSCTDREWFEAKTQEILHNWSQGKPHFESVRGLMAQLIQSGAVPLKNGNVDLDGAYDMALYANPEVRNQVLAAQQAESAKQAKVKADAERKVQQDQANKARRVAVGVSSSSPGAAPGTIAGRPVGKGRKSVRESILEAREALND